MSEYNLGTARGTIEIDYKGNGVDQAAAGLGKTSKAATSSDEAIRKTGTGFLVAGTAIVAGLGVAVKSAADFEKGLSGIQAVSGATQSQMDAVRKKALQLGADTAFSASDASAAIEELVKAGISIPDVMNGAADATVALAAAGGVDLPQAATIASNAMNQFGLTAQQLPGIADKIAGAANASAIDVSDFGQSMSQAGAVAHLAGLSFDDTALAITAMGNAGIKGSDAGTSLKSFLQRLQPTTKAQTVLMKKLGLVTKEGGNQFYDATGKIKPMSQIAGVLSKSLKGMSEAQKSAALQTLFGTDAIRAAAVIAEQGAGGMNKLSASINKVKAADVAATRMKNLGGQVEQLKGSAETLAIGIGSQLIPVLTKIVGQVTKVVNWFSQLDSGTQKAIVLIALFAAGLLLFIGTLVKLVQFAQATKAAMIALNGTFLANPIFLIIIAVIALIAAIVLLWKNSETFRNIVTGVWEKIKSVVSAVANWFTGTLVPWFQGVWDAISSGATALWGKITATWKAIQDGATSIWGAIAGFFTSLWSSITGGVTSAWNAIVSFFQTIWAAIVAVVTTYINAVLLVVTTVMNGILATWQAVWGLFGPLVLAVFDLIKAIVQVAVAWILVIVTAYLNMLIAVWTAIWNAVVAVATAVWAAITTAISAAVNAISSVVRTVFNAVKGFVVSVFNAVKNFVVSIWNAIWQAVAKPVNQIKAVVTSVFNAVRGVVTSVFNAIRGVAVSVWNSIRNTISSVVNSIRSTVSSAFNSVRSIASSIFSSVLSVIRDRINAAKSAVSSAVSGIKGIFSGAGSWLYNSGKALIQGLVNGIRSMISAAANAVKGVADKIRGFLPGSPIKEGPLKDHGWNQGRPGKQLMDLLAGGVESETDRVARALSGLGDVFDPSTLTSGSVAAAASEARTGSSRRFDTASPALSQPNGAPNVEFKVYNPVAEKSSETAVREMTRVAALGVF